MELHRACDLACEESSAGHSAKVLFSTRHLTGDATGLHLEVVDRSLDSLIQVQGVLIEMMPRRVLILNNMLKHPAVHALDQGVGRRNGLERVVRDILRGPCDRRQACAFATHALVEPESLRRRRIVPFSNPPNTSTLPSPQNPPKSTWWYSLEYSNSSSQHK